MTSRRARLAAPADPSTDALQLFLDDASRVPLLSAAEEHDLARRVERGDRAAKERMVTANLRLVVAIARRHQGQGLPLLDLIQEGALGLMRAVEKFDWRRGYRFSTYATWWIRQAVQRGLANQARTIRLPVDLVEHETRLVRAGAGAFQPPVALDSHVARARRGPRERSRSAHRPLEGERADPPLAG